MTSVLILLVSGEERPTHTTETLILQTEQGNCANKIHITAEAACQLSKLNRSTLIIVTVSHPGAYISLSCTTALELLKSLTCHSDFPDPNPLDVPGQAHPQICNASRVMSWFAS